MAEIKVTLTLACQIFNKMERAAAYDRTNLRFNYKVKLNDKITLSNKAAYTYTNSTNQQSSNTAESCSVY